MADTPQTPQTPQTTFVYYVVSTVEHKEYAETYKYKYLRRSTTDPTIDTSKEMKLKVAVAKYPADGSVLNTDPLSLLGWDPDNNTWDACQEWAFYDESVAKTYDDDPTAITGGFVTKSLTYFFYQGSAYKGTGEYKDRSPETGITYSATLLAPKYPDEDGTIVKDDKYNITWNGSGWTISPKGGGGSSVGPFVQTYKVSVNLGPIPAASVLPSVDTRIPAKKGYYEISTSYSKGASATWNGSMSIYIDTFWGYTMYIRGGEGQTQYTKEDRIEVDWHAGATGTIKVAPGTSEIANKTIDLYIRYWPDSYTIDDAKEYVKDNMLQDYDMTESSEGADEVIDKMSKLLLRVSKFALGLH